ncbi:MAG: hypothetical protein ABIO70_34410 [Pseudomonadota bacterium]
MLRSALLLALCAGCVPDDEPLDTAGGWCFEQVAHDDDGDGLPESIVTHWFDAAGRARVSDTDWDADGLIDGRVTYAYDEEDRLVGVEGDYGADGTVECHETRAYDARGRLVSVLFESDPGCSQVASLTTLTYAEDGSTVVQEHDSFLDGTVDSTAIYTYEGGLLVSSEWFIVPDHHQLTTYTYDERGRQVLAEWDGEVDGVVDSRSTWTYGEGEHPLTMTIDEGADDVIESFGAYTWTAAGDPLSETWYEGTDGACRGQWDWTYDADGNELAREWDEGCDGMGDGSYRWTYGC